RPAEAWIARGPVARSDMGRPAAGVYHRQHVMHDAAVARHHFRQREVPILCERRGHAEAAVDIAAAGGNREGLRAQDEVRRPTTGGGFEHAQWPTVCAQLARTT